MEGKIWREIYGGVGKDLMFPIKIDFPVKTSPATAWLYHLLHLLHFLLHTALPYVCTTYTTFQLLFPFS